MVEMLLRGDVARALLLHRLTVLKLCSCVMDILTVVAAQSCEHNAYS